MEKKKIIIIDCDSLMFSIANPVKMTDEYGNYIYDGIKVKRRPKTNSEIIEASNKIIESIITKTGSTHYIGFIKGNHTTSFRTNIKDDYKANRNSGKPDWWDFLKDHLNTKFKMNIIDNIEVDDAVLITYKNTPNSFICAIDKDLLNIEGTHYNFRKEQWFSNTKEDEINYLSKQMILGDTIDNIKGLPGKGESFYNIHINKVFNNQDFTKVLKEYIKYYNDDLSTAIEEFYKNFKCLYILRESKGFIIPEPIEYKQI